MRHFDNPARRLAKIRSAALRQEVMEDDGPSRVVVVEIDLPRPMLEPVRHQANGDVLTSRFALAGAEPDPAKVQERVGVARQGIESIIGRPPERYLEASGSFVVEANGEQIREIAELPSVAAIWANDRL